MVNNGVSPSVVTQGKVATRASLSGSGEISRGQEGWGLTRQASSDVLLDGGGEGPEID